MSYTYTCICDPTSTTAISSLLNKDKSPNNINPLKQTYQSATAYFAGTLTDLRNNFSTTACADSINIFPNKSNAYLYMSMIPGTASYKNAIGYFYYSSGNEPTSLANITSPLMILPWGPNGTTGSPFSLGDTFSLPYSGTFSTSSGFNVLTNPSYAWPAGLKVGLFIIPNGWSGGVLNTNIAPLMSLSACNPNSSKQCYQTTLTPSAGGYIVGFEDTPLYSGADQDYNDTGIHLWFK